MIFSRHSRPFIKHLTASLAISLTLIGWAGSAHSQETRVMPLEQVKAILDATKNSWVAFRNYDGRELIYFTQIISWHCGMKDIRYSLNSESLDQNFPVPACNKLLPNNIGDKDKIYLEEKPGSIKTLAVQVVYDDDSVSDIHIYQACPGAGEATCGQRINTIAAKSQ